MNILLLIGLSLSVVGILYKTFIFSNMAVVVEVNTFKEFYFVLGVCLESIEIDGVETDRLTIGIVFININFFFYK